MNKFYFLTIATIWFAYHVDTSPQGGAGAILGNTTTNYNGSAAASGVGAEIATAHGNGPNGTANLSIGSVGSASGTTFETASLNGNVFGISSGTGVSGVGNSFGTGSATGQNATVGIDSSGVGSGAGGHSASSFPGLPPNFFPPPIPAVWNSQRQGRTFFYNPGFYGYGGYYPYYNRYYLGRK